MNLSQLTLRTLLFAQAIGVLVYTFYVGSREGWGLFEIFLGDILSLTWRGQFDLDFSAYLLLSGVWIAWRNRFSAGAVAFAALAAIMGIIVFAPYLLYLLNREQGDIRRVLLGDRA